MSEITDEELKDFLKNISPTEDLVRDIYIPPKEIVEDLTENNKDKKSSKKTEEKKIVKSYTMKAEEIRGRKLANDDKEAKMGFRRDLIEWVKTIVDVWLVFTIIALFVYFYCCKQLIFISPTVIYTLLGTTTANILGLMAIVLHGLFDKKVKKK